MKRREFINKSCVVMAGFTSIRFTEPRISNIPLNLTVEEKPRDMKFRTLGKTGLKVSELGFGAMVTPDPMSLYKAIREYGINHVDTSRGYQGGQNEDLVAKGIGDKRKDVFIGTKFSGRIGDRNGIIKSVETSLQHLKTDYVDIIHLHSGSSKESIMRPEVLEAMTQLRRDGKVRFFGVSTHRNETEVVNAVAESNFYDVVLVKYNFKSPPELTEAIKKARAKGIGTIAMKTTAKLKNLAAEKVINTHQATLRWVLKNQSLDATIPSVRSTHHLDDNYEAVMAHSALNDDQILQHYGKLLEGECCRWCGECEISCPMGVKISEINRALMYGEGYGDYGLAKSSYSIISRQSNLEQCSSCTECTVRCPYAVRVQEKLERARAYFV